MRWPAMAVMGIVLGAAPAARAEGGRAELELKVLLRALSFDRNFRDRVGEDALLVVVFDSRDPRSVAAHRDHRAVSAALAGHEIGGVPLRLVDVDLATRPVDDVFVAGADAVLLLPGVDHAVDALVSRTRALDVASLGVARHHADLGVAIAVDWTVDGRPRLVVNLPAAREEGMDLSSQMLRLAEVRR